MYSNKFLLLLYLSLPLAASAQATPGCASTLAELRTLLGEPTFPLRWEETTMGDGKPLVVSISEQSGLLSLEFIKTKEGLWAQSAGLICKTGTELEARFTAQQIRLGPAANWVLRYALGNGGTFRLTRLGAEQMRIATGGWSGVFSSGVK